MLGLTSAMIDRTGKVWKADLSDHKTPRHGQSRILHFGPQAQLILARYLSAEPFGPGFALLRHELEYRYAADGTKQFPRVLLLLTDHPEADVRAAVTRCIAMRAFNTDAIENALRHEPLGLPSSRLDLSDRSELAQVGNSIRLAADYDVLFESQRDTDSDSQVSRRVFALAEETPSDHPVVDHREADAAPLAKTFASSNDALC